MLGADEGVGVERRHGSDLVDGKSWMVQDRRKRGRAHRGKCSIVIRWRWLKGVRYTPVEAERGKSIGRRGRLEETYWLLAAWSIQGRYWRSAGEHGKKTRHYG